MKKMWITMVLCGYLAMNLTACQSTPEEAAVVDKSEGLPPESILEVDNENPKELGISEHWEETLERQEGYITLEVDCETDLGEIYNTPVYEYEMESLSNEKLKWLCAYFADGCRLYKEPPMTKSQLEQEKEDMMEQTNFWRSEVYEKMDELIETAPEAINYEYVDVEFTVPYQTEREIIKSEEGNASSMFSEFYFETDEKIGFKARVDKNQELNPSIQVISYNKEVGSTSNFVYKQGTFVDELWLRKQFDNHKVLDFGEDGVKDLERLKEQLQNDGIEKDKDNFSEEDALEMIYEILKDLSLEGYAVIDCYKAIGTPDYEGMAELYKDDLILIPAYSVYLSYQAGSLMGYENPFQRPFDGLPEQTYAPSFSTEEIHIVVTEEGVQLFEWTNISKKTKEIANNTKLMIFGEIKEKFADHLLYKSIAALGEDSKSQGDLVKFNVKNVELRTVNVPAFENADAVWLVPAWVFTVQETWITEAMGELYMGEEVVVLNAIDGGYVRPRIDYRIPVR